MEERAFLYKICLAAISASSYVKFAAVVDIEGKLIVAKGRDITARQNGLISRYPRSYLFYLNYLVPAIRKKSLCSDDNPKLQFQSLDSVDNIKIATIKLPKSKDMYLCVCLDSQISCSKSISSS
jgi:hypothetical protein